MDDTQQVVDGDIVEEETSVASPNSSSEDATVLLSLEEMIKNNIESLETLQGELSQVRGMFEDSFNGDPHFIEKSEEAKKVVKAKSEVKQRIMQQPAVKDLADKVKHLRSEISERRSALSDYLQEFQRMTGATQIEGRDGKIHQIVNTAKVVNA